MGGKRQNIQYSLALDLTGRGESPLGGHQGTEPPVAKPDPESPALAEQIMEEVCERENCETAWKHVRKNKGGPGVDGMTIDAARDYLREHWPSIRSQLLDGTYQPQPVKRVEIPKPDGGVRKLGVPCVVDRLAQQAVLQVLQAQWDPTFSEHSYGFRPGRSAHQAVAQAQAYIAEGYGIVVDIDLEKFFDRVNQDRLMARVAERVSDKRVLKLIRAFLKAGVMEDGLVYPVDEGTPQGGPLSPTLSERSDNNGESPDPCGVPRSGSVLSSPSSTPTRTHFPTSRLSDPSATRIRSISSSLVRSKLSKNDSMSASRIQLTLPWYTAPFSARIASWALRPGRKPYEHSTKSCSYTASSTSRSAP